jgi:hypothetical protein
MEIHHEFTAWAVKNGLNINGIAPHRFPGRGLGIVAVERHEVSLISTNSSTHHMRYVLESSVVNS